MFVGLSGLVFGLNVTAAEAVKETFEGRIETMVVEGRQVDLVGVSTTASEGIVGQQEIQVRPLLRTGDVLEFVPGMVATQHSGSGKANQYFLRGFNLDHGTDFATYFDGMPVNMRTHAHGQGYTDLNFIIPETIYELSYKKGSYYADVGDFSGAGSAHFLTPREIDHGLLKASLSENGYRRALVMDSFKTDLGDILFAFEVNNNDGPWTDVEEDLQKYNGLIKYSQSVAGGTLSLGFMAYDNQWNSADQVPARAVSQGLIDELGSLDGTLGGNSSRYSLSASWKDDTLSISTYLISYDLNLWSNFTYFLDDQVNGDQFEQADERKIFGGQFSRQIDRDWFGLPFLNRFGADFRIDDIDEVGLYRTRERQRLGVIRNDSVVEESIGAFWESNILWTNQFKTILGARVDYYDFEVSDQVGTNINGIDLSANSGNASDRQVSLNASAVYQLNSKWELYASAGQGFHSNDARGTTISVDPVDGGRVDTVNPLVASVGYEAGVRGFISDRLNASIALWALELDSELVFVGDAGATEPSGASDRQGMELTTYYQFNEQWNLDVEYAYSNAEFKNNTSGGTEIPGAIEHVLQVGLNAELDNGWFGALRLRYFGERPLVEDGSVRSDSSSIWNLRLGYQLKNWTFEADFLNLTSSNDHDVDYFFESRLANEPLGAGTEDIHGHVFEPRTLRLSVAYKL